MVSYIPSDIAYKPALHLNDQYETHTNKIIDRQAYDTLNPNVNLSFKTHLLLVGVLDT